MWLHFIAFRVRWTRGNRSNVGYFLADKRTVVLKQETQIRGKDETIKLQQGYHFELLSRKSQLNERKTKGQKNIDCSVSLNSENEKAKNTSPTATF